MWGEPPGSGNNQRRSYRDLALVADAVGRGDIAPAMAIAVVADGDRPERITPLHHMALAGNRLDHRLIGRLDHGQVVRKSGGGAVVIGLQGVSGGRDILRVLVAGAEHQGQAGGQTEAGSNGQSSHGVGSFHGMPWRGWQFRCLLSSLFLPHPHASGKVKVADCAPWWRRAPPDRILQHGPDRGHGSRTDHQTLAQSLSPRWIDRLIGDDPVDLAKRADTHQAHAAKLA